MLYAGPGYFGSFLRMGDFLVFMLRCLLFHGSNKREHVQKLALESERGPTKSPRTKLIPVEAKKQCILGRVLQG